MNTLENTEKAIRFATQPVLIAAWPGPGNVGMMVLDYLRYKFDVELFAEVDMSSLFSLSTVPVKDGKFIHPAPPRGDFYFKRDPALILFKCDTHFAEKESLSLVNYLVKKAAEWNVSRIFTVGAFLMPMDHNELSEIRYAASEDLLAGELETHGFKPIREGEISGPIALVPAIAAERDIKAACILATMPAYAGTISYPKAAFEILKGLESLLHFHIDLSQIEEAMKKMEDTFEVLEDQVREHLPFLLSSNKPVPEEFADAEQKENDEPFPLPVKIRIEKLFEEASNDKSKAGELKKELDRLGVFKQFEDRFLDLFNTTGEGDPAGT